MLPAYGLYGHIRNNNIKSGIILGGFAFLIGLLWYAGCLYIVADIAKAPIMKVAHELVPFYVALVVCLAGITFFPDVVTVLPRWLS